MAVLGCFFCSCQPQLSSSSGAQEPLPEGFVQENLNKKNPNLRPTSKSPFRRDPQPHPPSCSPTLFLWASYSTLFFCIALNTDLVFHIFHIECVC